MDSICRTKKTLFPTEEAARTAMAAIRRRAQNEHLGGRKDVPNEVYRCPYCLEWHLTHNGPGWQRKNNGRKGKYRPGGHWQERD